MLSFASVPSCFYLLRIRLIFRVQPKCFLLNICLLYISLYPLCYVFDSHPQSSQIAIGSLSLVHVYESWKVLRILSALFFIGCYLYYIYPTHTHAFIHTYTQYGHAANLSRHCIAKPARMPPACIALRCAARLGTVSCDTFPQPPLSGLQNCYGKVADKRQLAQF